MKSVEHKRNQPVMNVEEVRRKEIPNVAIILVNYMHWEDTIECINSIRACTYTAYKILIVDNFSPNDAEAQLKKAFPDLELLQTGGNLGFTGGVNYGIRHVLNDPPDYVLIINPDTLVDSRFLDHLVHAMERNPHAAAAGATIYGAHDRETIWYGGGIMIPWRGLAIHRARNMKVKKESLGDPEETTFLTGCLMLFRASALEAIGPQDERFFMYLDDIELSARIRNKGYGLLYVPKSIIYHKVLEEFNDPLKIYFCVRNRFLLINIAFVGLTRFVARVYYFFALSAKMIFWTVTKSKYLLPARFGIEDYFRANFYVGRAFMFIRSRSKKDG